MPVVYKTDLTEVLFHQGTTPYTLVTFGNLGVRANGANYFGQSFVEKNGITCLGFVAAYPHWFPENDMTQCWQQVGGLLPQHRVISYGTSMGGYAALKYADLISAEVAIAESPQYSINPNDVPDDHRYRGFYREEFHTAMRISASPGESAHEAGHKYVLFDPIEGDDASHARLIATAMNVKLLRMPYTGHYSARVIASSDAFKQFIELALNGQDSEIEALTQAHRKQSLIYHAHLARQCTRRGHLQWAASILQPTGKSGEHQFMSLCALAENCEQAGDLNTALEFASQAQKLEPHNGYAYGLLGRLQGKAGQIDIAITLYEKASASEPGVARYYFELWHFLREHRRLDEAIASALEAAPRFSHDAYFARNLALMLCQRGSCVEAAEWLRRALRRDSRIPDFHYELTDVLIRLGCVLEAFGVAKRALLRFPDDGTLRARLQKLMSLEPVADLHITL